MRNIKYLIFDCMETLVDIDEFNETGDYAFHTYHGSGAETYWNGFDHFYQEYLKVRSTLARQLPENEEYGFRTLFRLVCESNGQINRNEVNRITDTLFNNYWKNYAGKCQVDNNVKETLLLLEKKYGLGILSNFKVEGGIEALLENNGISHHFDFVITSISVGWRKPDRRIYEAVMNKTNYPPEQHLFIGDDYENDFQKPRMMGMRTILFDRKDKYPHIVDRIKSISALKEIL